MLLEIDFSTHHNRTSMWIITPTIIHTRVDSTKINLWIQALVACNREDIIGINIQLKAVQPSVQIAESITQGQVLQANIRAILYELI